MASSFNVYKIRITWAIGSRLFNVRQDWNSAIPVPISGGGTGANTLAGAKAVLGIVDQLFTILYPGGTEAAPASMGIGQRVSVVTPFPGRRIACRAEIL